MEKKYPEFKKCCANCENLDIDNTRYSTSIEVCKSNTLELMYYNLNSIICRAFKRDKKKYKEFVNKLDKEKQIENIKKKYGFHEIE